MFAEAFENRSSAIRAPNRTMGSKSSCCPCQTSYRLTTGTAGNRTSGDRNQAHFSHRAALHLPDFEKIVKPSGARLSMIPPPTIWYRNAMRSGMGNLFLASSSETQSPPVLRRTNTTRAIPRRADRHVARAACPQASEDQADSGCWGGSAEGAFPRGSSLLPAGSSTRPPSSPVVLGADESSETFSSVEEGRSEEHT